MKRSCAYVQDHDKLLEWLVLGGHIQITHYISLGEEVLLSLLFVGRRKSRSLVASALETP
jgi:hypothetical protein